MKINILILNTLFILLMLACQTKTTDQNLNTDSIVVNNKDSIHQKIATEEQKSVFLIIYGKEIWIRDIPSTGKVILKLNEGDECKILEKGKLEIIQGRPDYWYKIEFNKTEGWVFGSQTDIMLFKPLEETFVGNLSSVCDDQLIQEIGTPTSFSYLFKKDNTFRFTVAAGYTIEGKTEWKNNMLTLKLQKLIMDSPEGLKSNGISGMFVFTVFKKDNIICLAGKDNKLKDKTYSPSGGCFCINE
jgi:hypothetical protein